MLVSSLSNKDNTFILLKQKDNGCNIYAENTRCFVMRKDSYKRMDSQEYEDRPSLEHKSLLS